MTTVVPLFQLPVDVTVVADCCDSVLEIIIEVLKNIALFLIAPILALCIVCKCNGMRYWRIGCGMQRDNCGNSRPTGPKGLPTCAIPAELFFPMYLIMIIPKALAYFVVWRSDGGWCAQYLFLALCLISSVVYALWVLLLAGARWPIPAFVLLFILFVWDFLIIVAYVLFTTREIIVIFLLIVSLLWIIYNVAWTAIFAKGYLRHYAYASRQSVIDMFRCSLSEDPVDDTCTRNPVHVEAAVIPRGKKCDTHCSSPASRFEAPLMPDEYTEIGAGQGYTLQSEISPI